MTHRNPYTKQAGFTIRLGYAQRKLCKWAQANFDALLHPASRAFFKCFEGEDSKAVVWALMHSATHGDYWLRLAIQSLGMVIWRRWLQVYEEGTLLGAEPAKKACA